MAIEILDPEQQVYRPLPDLQGTPCLALSASLAERLSQHLRVRVSTASSEVQWKAPWLHVTAGTRDPASGRREFLVHVTPYVAGTAGRYLAEVTLGEVGLLVVLDLEGEPEQPPEGVPPAPEPAVAEPGSASEARPAAPKDEGSPPDPEVNPAASKVAADSPQPETTPHAPAPASPAAEPAPAESSIAPPAAVALRGAPTGPPRSASTKPRSPREKVPVPRSPLREDRRPVQPRGLVAPGARKGGPGPWPWLSLAFLVVMGFLVMVLRSGSGGGEAIQPGAPSGPGGTSSPSGGRAWAQASPVAPGSTDGAVSEGSPAAATAGLLVLRLEPATVLVRVAGREERATGGRYQRELPAGTYEVLVRAGGYRRQAVQVQVEAGQTTERTVQMQRASGTLKVVGNPSGAEVFLNGRWTGKLGADGALHVRNLRPGPYEVKVRRSGWEASPSSRKVQVVDGQVAKATFRLDLPPAPEPDPLPPPVIEDVGPRPPPPPEPPEPEKF